VEPGVVFLPFHYGDDGSDDAPTAANRLTLSGWDPVSKQPYFKYAAVAISRVGGRDERQPAAARLAGRAARDGRAREAAATGATAARATDVKGATR
jgi:ferredoxin-nitrate reductase